MPPPSNPGPVLVNPVNKTCTPDPVCPVGRNATVVFKIDPAVGRTWKWSGSNPIVVTDGGGVFSGGSQNGNGNGNIVLQDRNDDDVLYKYTARLIQDGSTTEVVIDPSIQNSATNL